MLAPTMRPMTYVSAIASDDHRATARRALPRRAAEAGAPRVPSPTRRDDAAIAVTAIRALRRRERDREDGRNAPAVNATRRGPRGLQRPRRRDVGDAELVAHVGAELVVRHELLGDEARQARLDAAVLVDLASSRSSACAVLRLERLGLDAQRRLPRRRAASSPRCIRRRPSTSRRRSSPAIPAVNTCVRDEVAAATPITRLAVDTMPSLAPSTAARSQPRHGGSCGASCDQCWETDATSRDASLRQLPTPTGGNHARSRDRRDRPHPDRAGEQGIAGRVPSRRPVGADHRAVLDEGAAARPGAGRRRDLGLRAARGRGRHQHRPRRRRSSPGVDVPA